MTYLCTTLDDIMGRYCLTILWANDYCRSGRRYLVSFNAEDQSEHKHSCNNVSMATASAPSNKTNFARLGHACQDVIPKMWQTILLIYESPKDIKTDCNNNNYLRTGLSNAEAIKIAKAAIDGYANFDIPLLYKLFRNLNLKSPTTPLPPYDRPTKNYNHPHGPSSKDFTIGDELERCRSKRNDILHRGNANITDQEMTNEFKFFKEIAGRLEILFNKPNFPQFNFVDAFEDLETCCMDEETEAEYVRNLEILIKRDQDVFERLSLLEDEVKELKSPDREKSKIVFITPLRDKTCYEGETVSLECTVAGGKQPAKWYRDDNAVLSDNLRDESKDQTYKLTFLHATREDACIYTIRIGDENLEVRLDVIEREPSLIDLRDYQRELAEISLKGTNTIMCAGTNAGKTYVAFHIIEDHLLKNPKGRVVFINKTNVLLEQQYQRACDVFTTLHFQGKIYKWQAGEDNDEEFVNIMNNTSLLFLTPKSLSNHLAEDAKVKMSLEDISLLILDECHHTHDKHPYNEIMTYYRIEKYGKNSRRIPQVLGLTASTGTNKARDVSSAVDHLRKLMANLDVSQLSVVIIHKEQLLEYSTTPTKVSIKSSTRQNDPVKMILLDAIEYVEHIFNSEKVIRFQTTFLHDTMELFHALRNPPREKTELHYVQWMAETKEKIEHVLLKDTEVPHLLQTCFRHLELYADCLEVNSLLEIDQVRDAITKGYGYLSAESQKANTDEERKIVEKLKEVFHTIIGLGRRVEGNPDIKEIIMKIDEEFRKFGEESRFLIFVKARSTAEALSKRLPPYLRSTYLTGSHVSKDEGGRSINEQLEVVDHFRNGSHLCIVATSVACEGLDIQQCNVMIRYKFVADEISSLQMRGRIRQKEGTEVIVGSEKEIEFENNNIERQYLMTQAIEKVAKLEIARDIAIAERNIYESEELERQETKLKISSQRKGLFSIKCKGCKREIVDGAFIRHVNKKLYIVCDKAIFEKIERKPATKKNIKTFDGCQKREKVHGLQCGDNWGSIVIYKECEFVSLSQDYITFFDRQTMKAVICKKWADLVFFIPELSNDDFYQYNTQ